MTCPNDCDTCIDSTCEGCEYEHDKLKCELAGITYFDAQEGQL